MNVMADRFLDTSRTERSHYIEGWKWKIHHGTHLRFQPWDFNKFNDATIILAFSEWNFDRKTTGWVFKSPKSFTKESYVMLFYLQISSPELEYH